MTIAEANLLQPGDLVYHTMLEDEVFEILGRRVVGDGPYASIRGRYLLPNVTDGRIRAPFDMWVSCLRHVYPVTMRYPEGI